MGALLAYKLIGLLIAQALSNAGVESRGVSFKHTAKLWIERIARDSSATKDFGRLFTLIAQYSSGNRLGGVE